MDPLEKLEMRDRPGWLPLLARILLAVLFFTSSVAKIFSWSSNVEYIQAKHLPLAGALLAGALAIELATWISLTTGVGARTVAAIAFVYMIPVTLIFHTFMSTQFQKNLGIMGGLLMVASYGPGRFAFLRKTSDPAKMAG